MTTETKHEPTETPCQGEWCTQEVPRLPKISWRERVLRGRDAAVAWYVENRLRVWSWARVGAVALMFIGAAGYGATKAYRWAVKPLPLPVALPDKPKTSGSPGAARSTPKSTPQSGAPRTKQPTYNNQRTW